MTDLLPTTLKMRLQTVRDKITSASQHKTNAQSVQLLAVSKKHSVQSIETAYALGQTIFGENYVQEGLDKIKALADKNIEWHFIGPLQSNKSRSVAESFQWVHTIDREKIAVRLNEQRPDNLPPLNVLIQINISHQDSKSGIALNQLNDLAENISHLPQLKLRGLMCIPAPLNDAELKADFLKMQHAFLTLQKTYPQVDTLSMGMSADLSLAIDCGSTMVRIGSAIFGSRN